MRVVTSVVAGALMICPTIAFSQQGLEGSYSAQYWERDGQGFSSQFATFEIASARDGKINGKLALSNGYCQGEYSLQGTYQGTKLEMHTGAGAKRGCGEEPLLLEMQDGKLVGTISQFTVKFSRK